MLPLLKRYSEHYRVPANSQEYNELRETIHFDLTRLYNYTAINEARIRKNMDIVITQNHYLQNYIADLEMLLGDIEGSIGGSATLRRLSSTYNTHKNVLYELPDIDVNIPPSQRMHIDVDNQVANLPAGFSQSRITYSDISGNRGVYVGVEMFVYEGTTLEELNDNIVGNSYVNDPTIHHALDHKRHAIWAHESTYGTDTEELFIAVYLKLPSVDLVNTIELHPFPQYSLSINDIQYRNQVESWERIPTFYAQIHNAMNSKWVCYPIRANEFLVYMHQPNYYTIGNNNVFMYGLQTIDVQYNEYSAHGASMITHFSTSRFGDLKFKSIQYPKINTSAGSIRHIDQLITSKLYYKDDDDNIWPGDFNAAIPIGSNCEDVYVMTTMLPRDNITPIIKSIQIAFDTV